MKDSGNVGRGVLCRWMVLVALTCISFTARAADYGVFVDVETEEDLLDLLIAEELEAEVYKEFKFDEFWAKIAHPVPEG